jgi:iron complex outermembrane receptor protein
MNFHDRRISSWVLSSVAAVGALGLAGHSMAQVQASAAASSTSADSGLEEITVTARSVGETLNRVPVAVTVMTNADITRYGSSDLVQVAQLSPQIEVYGGGEGEGAAFLIRGMGTTGDDGGLEQSVALNLDGAQISRPRILFTGLFDLQQIEVLKGPQALFFGKNSPAGVISIKSENPTDQVSGYVKSGYEFNANERYVEAAFGGPINDVLRIRVAGRYDALNGWVRDIAQATPDVQNPSVTVPAPVHQFGPGSENAGGRVTVVFEPSSSYTSVLKATLGHYTDNGSLSTAEPVCVGGVTKPTTLGFTDANSDCALNGVNAKSDLPALYATNSAVSTGWANGAPFTTINSALATLEQTVKFDNFSLLANSAYSYLRRVGRDIFSLMEVAAFAGGSNEDYHGISQEVRLVSNFSGPLNFTVGGYYEHSHNYQGSELYFFYVGPDPTTGSYVSGVKASASHFSTYSGFAQARYAILPELELAAGARYTKETKDTEQANTFVNPGAAGILSPQGLIFSNRIADSNVSPEATLSWHPTESSTLYGAYKTGYKSGGIAVPVVITPGNTPQNLTFKPEKVKGGEVGYKNQMGRLRYDLTAYYYRFDGLQLSSFDSQTLSYAIQNAAGATQKGLEGEINYAVTSELTFRGAFGWNNLKYGSFADAACYAYQTPQQGCVNGVQNLTDKRLNHAPIFSGSAGIGYDHAVGRGLVIGLNADARYTGASFAEVTQNPASFQDSYVLINAGVRIYQEGSRGWDLAFIGRNLGNKRIIGFVEDKPGGGPGQIEAFGSRPRELTLQAMYHF